MPVIHKVSVPGVEVPIMVPHYALVLTVQMQGRAICAWYLTNHPESEPKRRLYVFGTGQPVPDYVGRYIATVQQGMWVWHYFDEALALP